MIASRAIATMPARPQPQNGGRRTALTSNAPATRDRRPRPPIPPRNGEGGPSAGRWVGLRAAGRSGEEISLTGVARLTRLPIVDAAQYLSPGSSMAGIPPHHAPQGPPSPFRGGRDAVPCFETAGAARSVISAAGATP